MNTKISVIIPCYNCEDLLENSIDSVINQTIGFENIELILVDDASIDNTKFIINRYAKKYDNIVPIILEKNSGGPSKPRNVGLEKSNSDYIMFLDSDDKFKPDICELLYDNISSENIDLCFGRYIRIFTNNMVVHKSYSPYEDKISEYPDDISEGFYLSKIQKFFWKNFVINFIYGKKILNIRDKICVKDISKHPNLLKILPSIWTKIYKTKIIKDNDIRFKPFYSGEDLNFLIEYYINSKNILFLNNEIVYEYYIRNDFENQSITKDISFKLIYDTLNSYVECCKICNDSNLNEVYEILLNPFLLNFMNIYSKFTGTIKENRLVLEKTKELEKIYSSKLKGKLLIYIIILMVKFSIFRMKLK